MSDPGKTLYSTRIKRMYILIHREEHTRSLDEHEKIGSCTTEALPGDAVFYAEEDNLRLIQFYELRTSHSILFCTNTSQRALCCAQVKHNNGHCACEPTIQE